jgi:hypothetical protein
MAMENIEECSTVRLSMSAAVEGMGKGECYEKKWYFDAGICLTECLRDRRILSSSI